MVMQGGALCSTVDEKEENMDNGNEISVPMQEVYDIRKHHDLQL